MVSNRGSRPTSTGPLSDIGFTIHDTGGSDTLDFSGATSGAIIDLRPGQFSSVNGNTNNIFIYGGHNADQTEYFIETAVGSAYADVIIGNAGNNKIIGNGGDDILTGGGSDDIFFFTNDFRRSTVTDFKQVADLLVFDHTFFLDYQAVLDNASQVGSDVIITADADNSVTLKSMTLSDFHTGDFCFLT